jgi:phosphate transport system permease protein
MTSAEVVMPQKPWQASPRQRLDSALVFILAIATSYVIVAITPMKGKLAYAFIFFIAFTAFDFTFHFFSRGYSAAKDAIARAIVALGISVAVFPIISILATVFIRGYHGLHPGL